MQKPSVWNNRISQADDLPDYTDLTSETVLAASLFFCQKQCCQHPIFISFLQSIHLYFCCWPASSCCWLSSHLLPGFLLLLTGFLLLLTGFSLLLAGFFLLLAIFSSADRLSLAADRLSLLARCYLLYCFECLADLRFTRIKSRAHPNASYILCPHSFMCHTTAVKPCTHCDAISIV